MLALNRSAIVVRPRLPLLEWLHAVDPTSTSLTLTDLCREPTIYLVPEGGDPETEDEYLDRVFHTIFEHQLDSWWARSDHVVDAAVPRNLQTLV